MLSVAIGTAGLSYASVPLYRMFCQATGFGGTVKTHKGGDEADGYDLPADPATLRNNRLLTISFNTDVDASLPWSFKPVQRQVNVLAGQTALAFFDVVCRLRLALELDEESAVLANPPLADGAMV